VDSVVDRLREIHGREDVVVLGWSQGALVAQLYAQSTPAKVRKLVLYASIYDPEVTYQRPAVFSHEGVGNKYNKFPRIENTMKSALEDFTLPGTIDHWTALNFASLALEIDPFKARWSQLHEFNLLSPSQIQSPTLVIAGALDPYSSQRSQAALFTQIPETVDKAWVSIAGSDHAAHLLGCKNRWLEAVLAFLNFTNQAEEEECPVVEGDDADDGATDATEHPYFTSHGLNI